MPGYSRLFILRSLGPQVPYWMTYGRGAGVREGEEGRVDNACETHWG